MMRSDSFKLAVIVPVFNEEQTLDKLHFRLLATLNTLNTSYEIIFVNDGSTDDSQIILEKLHHNHPSTSVIKLSRNFGKEAAMSAGLKESNGDVLIILDADLQHPPEIIPFMIDTWMKQKVDLVNMKRRNRATESWKKRTATKIFYQLMNRFSDTAIPSDVGDFRLLSRKAVDAINQLDERNRFMKGLFAWIGFKQVTLEFDVEDRLAGDSKWNFFKLSNFALDGLVAFSVKPLRFASYTGILSAVAAFCYALHFLITTLIFGDPVPGFPTLIVTILFIGGLQLMAIGILGEYIGRLFIENKQRPLYIIEKYLQSKHELFSPSSHRDLR